MPSTVNASTSSGLVLTSDLSGVLELQSNGTTVATANSSGFNLPTNNTLNAANTFGFKNRIINGAMVIDQRNAGASVTPTTTGTYTLDRWSALLSVTSKFSMQQNAGAVTPPAGFTNYLGCTSLSAYSVGASEFFAIRHLIEGFNVADLGWGTSNAQTVTLSFWVRSSLTGTFGGAIRNDGNTRSHPYSFNISAANTWEYKTVTIAGDTTGTWAKNNTLGINVTFNLGAGSTVSNTAGSWYAGNFISTTGAVSVVGTNGATFYITGVQLEVGTQATSFDFRSIGQELALCQRYFEKSYEINVKPGTVTASTTTVSTFPTQNATYFNCTFQVSKRTACTMTAFSPSSGAAGNQSENMVTDIALAGFISNGVNQACAYSATSANTSNYLHFTADAEL
jgi:hypothetical protein